MCLSCPTRFLTPHTAPVVPKTLTLTHTLILHPPAIPYLRSRPFQRNGGPRSPQLMAELRALVSVLEDLGIELQPRYSRSELNPADEFSWLIDRDDWKLRSSTQRMLQRKTRSILGGHHTRCVHMSPIQGLSSLCISSLRQRRPCPRRARSRLVPGGSVDQPTLVSSGRYHWQIQVRAARSGAAGSTLAHTDLVVSALSLRRLPPRSATAQVLHRHLARSPGGALPPRRAGATSRRIATWDAALTRAVLGSDLHRGGPFVERLSCSVGFAAQAPRSPMPASGIVLSYSTPRRSLRCTAGKRAALSLLRNAPSSCTCRTSAWKVSSRSAR